MSLGGDPGMSDSFIPDRIAHAVPLPEGAPPAGQGLKLLDRVRLAVRSRHYSRRTEQAYVHWIRQFIVFHGKRHPVAMGGPEIAKYLSWLATERRVSSSTQNQAFSALLFLSAWAGISGLSARRAFRELIVNGQPRRPSRGQDERGPAKQPRAA